MKHDMTNLVRQMRKEPHRFDFFQAMRLLRIAALTTDEVPRGRSVGEDYGPDKEFVRFRTLSTFRYPAQPMRSISTSYRELDDNLEEHPVTEMVVTFMGLTGPHGVLPRHYTQLLIDRIRERDFALRDFLDLFNHRVISLFYRAWEKHRFPVVYESTALQRARRGDDLFTRCLYALTGHGLPGLRQRLETSDELFLYYGGLFAQRRPTAVSLESMLVDYLGVPARILQFQGQWLYLTVSDQSSLPTAEGSENRNNQLGQNVVIGRRVWDIQHRFRVHIGPVTYAQFRRLMPSGDRLARVCQVIRTYVGPSYDFDLQVVLKSTEAPRCCLGNGGVPSRLGWNTWLRSAPLRHDVDDAVFVHEGTPSR